MKYKCLILLGVFFVGLVMNLNATTITVKPVYLSTGLLHNKTNYISGLAFDSVMSVPVLVNVSEQDVSVEALFAVGVGSSRLGFPGSEIVLNDLLIHKKLSSQLRVSVGSFDMPLGLVTDTLSNNANFLGSVFILNPIYMDALVGAPVGTLNTVGVKGFWQYDHKAQPENSYGLSVSISNGTNETAYNTNNNLAFAVSSPLGIGRYIDDDLVVQVSGVYSDDSHDTQDSLGLKMSGFILEANWDITADVNAVLGFGQKWFANKNNDALVDVGYVALTKKFHHWQYGLRFSLWRPESLDRDDLSLPQPLFFSSDQPIQELTRLQTSFRYIVNQGQYVSCEFSYDRAIKTSDVTTTGCFYTLQIL